MKRQVFYSFYYDEDNWRAQQIRNIGVFDGSPLLSANDWEEVKRKGDDNIKRWIDEQLEYRSCLIVLIGKNTYSRKWVQYEIEKAHKLKKGLLGIYVHNLKDSKGNKSSKGLNPFVWVSADWGFKIKTFDPNPNYPYADIKENIEQLVEDAIDNS